MDHGSDEEEEEEGEEDGFIVGDDIGVEGQSVLNYSALLREQGDEAAGSDDKGDDQEGDLNGTLQSKRMYAG